MAAKTSVFISYRRSDSSDVVGRANQALQAAFDKKIIFRDEGSIPAGADFASLILETLQNSAAALVMIGPNWLNAKDDAGKRRLDDPDDLVRVEVDTALRTEGLTVIPVLVNNAPIPSELELPLPLRKLRNLNVEMLRRDPDFQHDMDRIISELAALGVTKITPVTKPTESNTINSTGPGAINIIKVSGSVSVKK